MIVEYKSSVFCPQIGWRGVYITASAKSVSAKMIEIIGGVDINGDGDTGYASRTGAKRQQYNVGYFAEKEIGKRKRLSCVNVIEE